MKSHITSAEASGTAMRLEDLPELIRNCFYPRSIAGPRPLGSLVGHVSESGQAADLSYVGILFAGNPFAGLKEGALELVVSHSRLADNRLYMYRQSKFTNSQIGDLMAMPKVVLDTEQARCLKVINSLPKEWIEYGPPPAPPASAGTLKTSLTRSIGRNITNLGR